MSIPSSRTSSASPSSLMALYDIALHRVAAICRRRVGPSLTILVGVTDRLLLFLAEAFQGADQEKADWVLPQIGRNEPDAGPSMRMADLPMAYKGRVEACRVLAVVLGMGLG